jgi:hypothetical protein
MEGARSDETTASEGKAVEQAPVSKDLLDRDGLLEVSEVQMPRDHA